jgi:hypothetical protein
MTWEPMPTPPVLLGGERVTEASTPRPKTGMPVAGLLSVSRRMRVLKGAAWMAWVGSEGLKRR